MKLVNNLDWLIIHGNKIVVSVAKYERNNEGVKSRVAQVRRVVKEKVQVNHAFRDIKGYKEVLIGDANEDKKLKE